MSTQPIAYGQSFAVANNQAREADIRAIYELTRALDKKVIKSSIHSVDHLITLAHLGFIFNWYGG